jgi:hypothetical protein
MAMTQAIAQAHLDAWLQADLDVASGKSVRVDTSAGSRAVTSEDAAEISKQISKWQGVVDSFVARAAGASGDPNVRLATWS